MALSSSLEDQVVASLVERRDWRGVLDALTPSRGGPKPPKAAHLEILTLALWWLGRVDECIELRHQALECYQRDGEMTAAGRMALLLSEDHRRRGRCVVADTGRPRAAQLLEGQPEGAEHGYLRLYQGEVARRKGDLDAAQAQVAEAMAIAGRVGDADLAADATQELGRVMILDGDHAQGLAVMDDAMLAASEGRLSPYTTGKIYCCLMSACDELGDLQRVAEWERTSSAWSRHDGVEVFPGMCRVHHADLLAHHGHWSEAEAEAARACDELREVGWVVSYAYNTIGQIRCRRGDLAGAAAAFVRAEELGDSPEAGLSLLLLARGDVEGAMGRIARAVAATPSPPLTRARLLPVLAEIAVAAGELDAATAAVDELDSIAAAYGTLKLQATAWLARARLALAQGDWVSAAATAAVAVRQWQELEAPYEQATARVLQGRACRALDDHDGWARSLDIAAGIFTSLGAATEVARVQHLRQPPSARGPEPALDPAPAGTYQSATAHQAGRPTAPAGLLTAREVEVVRLVATGATNKMIAAELVLSQKTVSRHLSNIFAKLGISTRAAATAYAYEHGLAGRAGSPDGPNSPAGPGAGQRSVAGQA